MTLKEYIWEHADELLDLPEEPDREEFEFCRFVNDPAAWYGYHEECGFNDEAYEEALSDWERACDRVYDEFEFDDWSEIYLVVDGAEIEDYDEIRTYLDRQVERVDKTAGYGIWIA